MLRSIVYTTAQSLAGACVGIEFMRLIVRVRLQGYPELNAVPVRNIAYDCLTANDCQWSAVVMPRLNTWRGWLAEHSKDVYGVVNMATRLIRVSGLVLSCLSFLQ